MEYTEKNFNRTIITCAIIAIGLVLLFTSCKSPKKIARKQIYKIARADNVAKRKGCDTCGLHYFTNKYPIKVAQGKTVYIPGKKQTIIDTFKTVEYTKGDTVIVTLTHRINTVVHDTVLIHDTVTSSAEVAILQSRLTASEQERNNLSLKLQRSIGKNEGRGNWWPWVLVVILVVLLVWKVIK